MRCNLATVWGTVQWERLGEFAPHLAVLLNVLVATLASAHVILNKHDTRSAIAWVGFIWLVPFFGTALYLLLGINRIRRRARELKSGAAVPRVSLSGRLTPPPELEAQLGLNQGYLTELARVGASVTRRPLLAGNRIETLVDGDEAYPAMLEAIRQAESSISFASYIFEATGIGAEFVDALDEAQRRGVEVRVLIDDVGTRYGRPKINRVLRKRKIRVACFLPALLPRGITHFNLRNHRKIMVVDGRLGFTGGINIRQSCVLASSPAYPTRDLHFRVRGPVVAQLQEAFVQDWVFTTGEQLEGAVWFPPLERSGETLVRGVLDGPDRDVGNLHWMFLAAVLSAQRSVRLMTPYFLPDDVLVKALNVAAMRGVEVDIVVPEVGNLPVVRWAMWAQYRETLGKGCRLWLTPPPFDHSKVLVIDGSWVTVGSGNWDPRSLQLNFEFNLECYDARFAKELEQLVDERIATARMLTEAELAERSIWLKLRDGLARLLEPYL
jgi:cardiolipin synthase